MDIIQKRDVIKGVLKRWKSQYPDDYKFGNGETSGKISTALSKLNLRLCSAEDVDKIMGNQSWTRLECDVCENDAPALLALGPPHSSECGISICADCVADAAATLALIKNKP